MKNPLLSVIIPCYNSAKYLADCFKSLDNQTYNNLHVIFINDGSTDDTLNLLKEYCGKHPSYTLISGENRGVSSAKNSGLNAVQGELFTFFDPDDILYNNHFELLVKGISENNAGMAVCGIERVAEKRVKKIKPDRLPAVTKTVVYDKVNGLEQLFSQEKLDYCLVNKIFVTEILKKSGARFIEGTRYGEEGYFFFPYLSLCEKTVYYGAKTYVYIQHKGSLMHVAFNETRLDIYTNLDKTEELVKEPFPTVVPYVKVMRAGYSVGLLYFIRKAKYKKSEVIATVVTRLCEDVKAIKKAPKIALYKKICLPIVARLSRHVFRKHLKKVRAK